MRFEYKYVKNVILTFSRNKNYYCGKFRFKERVTDNIMIDNIKLIINYLKQKKKIFETCTTT